MYLTSRLLTVLVLVALIGCGTQPVVNMGSKWTMVYQDSQAKVLLFDALDGHVDITNVDTAWKRGHRVISISLEGSIRDPLFAEESWYDAQGLVITKAHRFTRRFNLAEKGFETLTWRAPVPQGAFAVVRIGCSAPCGYQKDLVKLDKSESYKLGSVGP